MHRSTKELTYSEKYMPTKITSISVRDIRFPTSEGLHGFDAFHKDPIIRAHT